MGIREKTQEIVNLMTVEEKAQVCVGKNFWEIEGVSRLGINSIKVADGPHGLRKQSADADHLGINESVPATCFPTASLLASTWNRELIHKMGNALARECVAEDVSVLLGPGVNIKRSPLGGRNFEYFSEDPFVSSEIAIAWINGVQELGVGASLKHFAVNNQEYRRMLIDTIVDERTLREVYLSSFEDTVKLASPSTVMCAYNRLNGTYCSENKWLLTDVLREDWLYKGVLITDWGATNDRVKGLIAGQDVEMPGVNDENVHKIISAVESGKITMKELDGTVARVISLLLEKNNNYKSDFGNFKAEHHKLAREIASEGIVLLKNDGILPLSKNDKVAIIGNMARSPRYQGSGSSFMNPTQLDTVYECLKARIENDEGVYFSKGYIDDDIINQQLVDEAVSVAQSASVTCIFVGLSESYESEGFDRTDLTLPKSHENLIEAILHVTSNVVVVLSNGAPVCMPWKEEVSAIIEGYLSGQAGASAMLDIIFGDINPSGKLAETFPEETEVSQYFKGSKKSILYKENVYVGYKYYDRFGGKVAFPFGHGLSYTTFDLWDNEVVINYADGMFDGVTASINLSNIGHRKGKTVVQAYVSAVDGKVHRPLKVLGQFEKIELEANESKRITLELKKRTFEIYNTKTKRWHVEPGRYNILIGFSSVDLPLKVQIDIPVEMSDGEVELTKADQFYIQSYGQRLQISDQEFLELYGLQAYLDDIYNRQNYDLNTPIYEMRKTIIGSLLMLVIKVGVKVNMRKQKNAGMKKMIASIIEEVTLRNLVMMTGGIITHKMTESFLVMSKNGFFTGLRHFLKKSDR